MMKQLFCFFLLLFTISLSAQTRNNYALKAGYMGGVILKHTTHLQQIVEKPTSGFELGIEWQTLGEQPWHSHLNYPRFGLGAVSLHLGNPDMLGNLYALYPYLSFHIIQTPSFVLNVKGGAGVSFLTKTFSNTATNPDVLTTGNAAIGSVMNVYFAGGLNAVFPLDFGFAFFADVHWNHASNGSFYQPNSGLNMLHGSIGLNYAPYYKHAFQVRRKPVKALSQTLSVELVAAGGARELYYRDNKQFPTGSFVISAYKPLGNAFRLGLGVEGFYDGVYDGTTKFQRTYLTENKLKNKLRLGLALRPELVFGRFTAGIHAGVYLFNPLKNLEPYDQAKSGVLNKPLFYKYNIEEEDGWLYTRAALQYRLVGDFFLSIGLKTHLHKAEFIEWGLGYKFNYKKRELSAISTSN